MTARRSTAHLTAMAAFLILVFAVAARADDLRREVDALRPADVTARAQAVLDNLERRAREALAAIPRSLTAHDADRMRATLRQKLEQSLGTNRLPKPAGRHPRLVGTLAREGYRIEKIIYESLPGAQVPLHLYIPDRADPPAPAVLFYPGHWWTDSKARPDFQAFCINMARLGFVVLSFDPGGQGERGVSSRDHRRTEALLVGVAQQGFAEFETRCALAYLLTRKEVDPRRIGITGASGGGFNTWITTALDDRIAAAVSVVGTSEFAEQIHVCRPLDWYHAAEHCHFVPGLIRYANNHELLAMAAPKPVLIIAASEDESFPLAGVRQVADYGRTLYQSYGASDKTGLVVDEREGHGYQKAKREAAYGWFLRWLSGRGDGRPSPEPPTQTAPADAEELRCFPVGHNQPAGPAMIETVELLMRDLPPPLPRIDLRAVLGETPPTPPAPLKIQGTGRLQRLVIPTESDLDVPAFLLRPAGRVSGIVIAVDDRGKEALASDPVLREANLQGWAVCGVDPRGIGESAGGKTGWVFAVSLLLGESFVGRQAWDIARVQENLRAPGAFFGTPIGLYARGQNACLAATYALLGPGPRQSLPRWYLLRDGYVSYRAFINRPRSLPASYRLLPEDRNRITAFDREIPAAFFVFNVFQDFDLPQLLGVSSAKGLIVNPVDGDGDRLPEAILRNLLPKHVRAVSAIEPAAQVKVFLDSVLEAENRTGRVEF